MITVDEKLIAIKKLDAGGSVVIIATEYGVGKIIVGTDDNTGRILNSGDVN